MSIHESRRASPDQDLQRALLDQSPHGVFVVDAGGHFVLINRAASRLTGHSPDELLGLEFTSLVTLPWRDRARARFERLRAAGRLSGEIPYLHRDGSLRWCWLDAVRLDAGRYAGFAVEVGLRRRLRRDLERERARLARAQDIARVGWWEFDFTTRTVEASAQTLEIYGASRSDPMTIAWAQSFPLPEDRPRLDAALAALIDGRAPYDVTFRIQRPVDGRIAVIHSVAEFDRERNVAFGVLQDITVLQQAETALRVSEIRLRTLFDSARDFIFLKDRDLNYTHVNRACEELLQLPFEAIVGQNDAALFGSEHAEENRRLDLSVLQGNTERSTYARHIRGKNVVIEMLKVPVRDDRGEVTAICGVGRDITAVRQLEEQLRQAQKLEAIGRLAGGIAHDFNNLLTPILGFTDLVLESLAADDPRRADLTTVVRAASRARDLTAQLLAFGRKQVLDMLVLDLNEVVLESEPMVRRLLRENINLKLSLAADLGAVCADLSQIHNVLINLVVNAADAMPDGGTLTIETHNVDLDETYLATHPGSQPGPHVQLAVSDDGYGMDQRTIDLIFEPFFTTKSGGTGLGLATVHGIVKQHQGSVWVYSEPGRGSTFKIYLPRVVAVPLPLVPAAPRELRGSEQILVVEDDDAVRTLAAAVLTTYGYQVVAVASPAAAVDLMAARTDPFALLLSDVVMPGMNGAQLHRALSARWPQLPALYMSGYTSNVIAHHGILSEGTQFLQKPFSPADLARKVREVLDG
ncbi:MAG TPA: PAS domain S-box protein [Candidatus Krumholzibacteria bacterium]|nr:PAS domain S-box protein [Candidatus Krumholzibacteria bacterium]HPD70548.1 PAS domain S-box protein [Candidatus Krumholzibacteria bacterium]HRY39752.1 PAS domain S-box protein [Candidatus Krumholzibacteria bacterium]